MKFWLTIIAATILPLVPALRATQADDTTIEVIAQVAGPTPFIKHINLEISDRSNLRGIQFIVVPKAGSVIRPIRATYGADYLESRGFLRPGSSTVVVPVFGLYANRSNTVELTYRFQDGSEKQDILTVATTAYDDPCHFDNPTVLQARTPSTALSYDYMLVKSACSQNSPTVLDTDGEIRWVGSAGIQTYISNFVDNSIWITEGPTLYRLELDGAVEILADYTVDNVVAFDHNIDRGKNGYLIEPDTHADFEAVIWEVDLSGNILKTWNMAEIISDAMIAGGDDPDDFVVRGEGFGGPGGSATDWFHTNASTYRASDDTVIISSRENFIIALDYETSEIKWILGDPTKKWYQFASLRQYALDMAPGSTVPIGQHALSITYDDKLLLMDNGAASRFGRNVPAGASRPYAAGRKYSLDLEAGVVTEVYNFTNNESVFSPFCSSFYEDAPDNYLVDYAIINGLNPPIFARLLGLDATGAKVFDYQYPSNPCTTAYNSSPIHWENLVFRRPLPPNVQLVNMSARAQVGIDDGAAIAGFIVTGSLPKHTVVRGLGPSLRVNGQPFPGLLQNPVLELHDSDGNTLEINDDFADSPGAAAVTAAGLAPADESESAISKQLAPGAYTAVLRGSDNTTGIGLVEVYDLDPEAGSTLANLSARAFVSTGDKVLIGGIILQGIDPKPVLFRAIGPSLATRGVLDSMQDPTVELYDVQGTLVASNDNWPQAQNAVDISATGLQPTDPRESAILLNLNAGNYTAVVRGVDDSTGTALVEAFRLN